MNRLIRRPLVVNAFYASQQIFGKAYDNYLGLAQLGAFMTQERGMALARLNVVGGVAKLEGIAKSGPSPIPLAAAVKALTARAGVRQTLLPLPPLMGGSAP